jgi:hypothetical protein
MWNSWREAATDAIQEAWTTPDWTQWGSQGAGAPIAKAIDPKSSLGLPGRDPFMGGTTRRAYPPGEYGDSIGPGVRRPIQAPDEDNGCEPLKLPWRSPEPCLPKKGGATMTTEDLEDECGGAPCAWKRRAFPTAWSSQGFQILIHPPRFDPDVGTWRLDELCEEVRLVLGAR